MVHLALQERPIDIDFILHLAVRIIEVGLKEAGQMRFQERAARRLVF
jgi:hypothetical protein